MGFAKFPAKDADEELDYVLDLTALAVSPSTIQSAGTSVVVDGPSSPGGLTDLVIDSVVVAANKVFVWLDDGTLGETYTLKFTAVDNNSPVRKFVRRVTIQIKKK